MDDPIQVTCSGISSCPHARCDAQQHRLDAQLQLLTQEYAGEDIADDADFPCNGGAGVCISHTTGAGKTVLYQNVINAYRQSVTAIQKARKALDLIKHIDKVFGSTPALQRQAKYWHQFLVFHLAFLAKLFILFAYSRSAIVKVPLFADGPELSGYKHRLR